MYVTIVGCERYVGIDSYKIGEELVLEKDKDNKYDDEAIIVKNKNDVIYGYVANSVHSVARGSHSAGYIYSSFKDKCKCKIEFILKDSAIAKIL